MKDGVLQRERMNSISRFPNTSPIPSFLFVIPISVTQIPFSSEKNKQIPAWAKIDLNNADKNKSCIVA